MIQSNSQIESLLYTYICQIQKLQLASLLFWIYIFLRNRRGLVLSWLKLVKTTLFRKNVLKLYFYNLKYMYILKFMYRVVYQILPRSKLAATSIRIYVNDNSVVCSDIWYVTPYCTIISIIDRMFNILVTSK